MLIIGGAKWAHGAGTDVKSGCWRAGRKRQRKHHELTSLNGQLHDNDQIRWECDTEKM